MTNPIKLRLLLECYLEYRKTHHVDLSFLMGWADYSREMRSGGDDFDKLAVETQADVFLKACRAAAAKIPSIDWRLLDVFEAMPPARLMSDVFPAIDATSGVVDDAEPKLLTTIKMVTLDLWRFGFSKNIPRPFPDVIFETLCLLGFFQHDMSRHPIVPENAFGIMEFLEGTWFYSPQADVFRFRLSELIASEFSKGVEHGSDLYRRLLDDRKTTRQDNGKKIMALGRDFQYLWILEAIGDEDPVQWIESIPTGYHAVAHEQLYKHLLKAAERTAASLGPMVDYCNQEMEYIKSSFHVGSSVRHVKFGVGTVAKNTGKYVTIDFPDGVRRRFLLLHTVFKERLTVDTEEFHDRLFFSLATLKNRDYYTEQYELATSQLQELSDNVPPLPRLLRMKTVDPTAAWLAQKRYQQK